MLLFCLQEEQALHLFLKALGNWTCFSVLIRSFSITTEKYEICSELPANAGCSKVRMYMLILTYLLTAPAWRTWLQN